MNSKQLVKKFKQEFFDSESGTPTARELAETYGFRLRQTKDSKEFGTDCWELATTYFYQIQESTTRQFRELKEFAAGHGFRVTVVSMFPGPGDPFDIDGVGRGNELDELSKDQISFWMRPWPKSSWAVAYIAIREEGR